MEERKTSSIIVMVPAGRLPLAVMKAANELAEKHSLELYLTTAQNLRLNNVSIELVDEIKAELAALGAVFKEKGKFPLPRVCVGNGHCNLGIGDTSEISKLIMDRFGERENVKAKFKVAISGCPTCCSNPRNTDIGIITTRNGFDIYAGGKGGVAPEAGRRIARKVDENEMLDIVEKLVDFHDAKTGKKQRIFKLLNDPEFPFAEV
ncbi:nitrite reductase [Desulfosediminicola sp.]|uniref:nitrite reductase n=1 Tax=Desulfosediminicola sp. TaxID=2886825 RepID=UPI003AF28601